ncbi:MAG: hypothetical protein M3M88_00290 [Thermoproteota archaeon]|nr:hypothetical protein [Thermoproteota archaeon]
MAVWDQSRQDNPTAANGEAARRYFSTKEYMLSGAENMFSKPQKVYDAGSLMISVFQVILGMYMITSH